MEVLGRGWGDSVSSQPSDPGLSPAGPPDAPASIFPENEGGIKPHSQPPGGASRKMDGLDARPDEALCFGLLVLPIPRKEDGLSP